MSTPTAAIIVKADFDSYWAASGKADFWNRRPDGAQAYADALDAVANFTMAPTITDVTPTHGPAAGGTKVYISGSGFAGTTGVLFDDVAATGVVVVNDTLIECVTAAEEAGSCTVTVSNPKGDGTKATAFTFV